MKKILVITPFFNEKQELFNEFIEYGLKKQWVKILAYQRKHDNKLLDFVRKNRPPMIILDGRTNPHVLDAINELIDNAIGVYDIDSKIFIIKKWVNLRGVTNVEMNELLTKVEPLFEKPKKCREKGCAGFVDLTTPIILQIGCESFDSAYPCKICKRLYWFINERVSGVKKRSGEKAFA